MDLSNALSLASVILTAISTISILTIIWQIWINFKRLLFDQENAINVQCGSWQICITDRQLPERGLVEKVADPLKGWIRNAYEKSITINMTTCDRITQRTSCGRFCCFPMPTSDQTAQGTSSWSKLLARCGVEACKIPRPERTEDMTDILMENERILYGVSAEEFVVLLILGSWDITFAKKEDGLSISHLGYMRICDNGPFRQIARYDDHGITPNSQSTANRYRFSIPVKTAIDLAIGIFRIPSRGPDNINMVILPDRRSLNGRWLDKRKKWKRRSRIGPPKGIGSVDEMSYWTSNPDDKQAEELRFSLEKLVQEPSAQINNYAVDKSSTDKMEMFLFVRRLLRPTEANHDVRKAATRVALVISSLEPWAILPAAPRHITHALCGILKMQVQNDRGQEALKSKLKGAQKYIPPGWTQVSLESALDDIPSIKDRFFSQSSDKCSIYHTAMKAVFRKENVSQHSHIQRTSYPLSSQGATIDIEKLIRFTLAAVLASRVLSKAMNGDYVGEIFKKLCEIHGFSGGSTLPLHSDHILVNIYATYLYGWFGNATKAGRGWREAYQRRIFME